MKPISILKFNLVFVMILGLHVALAGTLEEKKKLINKSYPINASTVLKVSNQFGEVHLEKWDKQELKVKIEIIVNGKTEDRARQMLDKINVAISEGSTMSFITEMNGNMNSKNDESFKINYWINMPSTNKIDIENKFGDTYIDDWKGDAEIEVGYGNLKTMNFEGFLDLELSFGKGTVGALTNAEMEVKYSDLDVQKVVNLEMEQQFSNVTIGSVGTIEVESKYGELVIGEVDVVEADAQFSGFSIEKLNKQMYLEASYISDFEIEELNKDFSKIEIYGKFSNYTLRLQDGTNAELEGEFSFSNMSVSNDQVDIYRKVKDANKSEYKARIGKGDSGKRIIVKSSYGDLKVK
ncbi:hypothetical protein [Marinoscillum pacificum]|uniref:hypothetical protein n=1 Tax=Marinoscillum pacificum TaxID=392723 RepID=UPI002157A681|nr:hypothetical protein [Marinoscillum pacificum]